MILVIAMIEATCHAHHDNHLKIKVLTKAF